MGNKVAKVEPVRPGRIAQKMIKAIEGLRQLENGKTIT
jgi:hypothetical protein